MKLTLTYVVQEVVPDVHLVTGVGGAGMTLSFGLAERVLLRPGRIEAKRFSKYPRS